MTRASMKFVHKHKRAMDCRVKPGNDSGGDGHFPGLLSPFVRPI
jgi:hypothetical protein